MAVLGYTAIKFWVISQLAYCLYSCEALALVSLGTTMHSFQAWAGVTGSVLFAHAETKAKCWGVSAGSLAGSNLLQVHRIRTQYRAAGNLEGRLEKAFVGTCVGDVTAFTCQFTHPFIHQIFIEHFHVPNSVLGSGLQQHTRQMWSLGCWQAVKV